MRQSVTQEFDYGCGVACFAFATQRTYEQAAAYLGLEQATSARFWVKDLTLALNGAGMSYRSYHLKPTLRNIVYTESTIVLIRRSKRYPAGHYLIRHDDQWMDPWINLPTDRNIANANSGYRKRLPGKPMYAIVPIAS